ncbi:MAG: polysaccharide biosynthesis C-terminal domain-containing protein, partial [Pseudomonadota bacterium]
KLRDVVLQVRGLFWQRASLSFAVALANVGLTILAVPIWGLTGAAVATAIGLFAGLLASNHLLKRRAGVDVGLFYQIVARSTLPTLALAALIAVGCVQVMGSGWSGLVRTCALFLALCAGLVWVVALTQAERDGVRRRALHALRSVVGAGARSRWVRLR